MLLPQQWEVVAAERMREWDKEIERYQLLARLPQEPARWRRWTGSALVRCGFWLMRWGERLVRRESQEGISVAG
jgi:hypothetical protein